EIGAAEMSLTPLIALSESGYYRLQNKEAALIVDVAPIGPDYQPGHAHADTLSFELSLFSERLVVNSGTSRYGNDEERQRQRGTRAHNTVTVDGMDSSEVWSGFRVARRAFPTVHALCCNDSISQIEGSHDGYRRLKGRVRHTRRWVLADKYVEIVDVLSGRFTTAEARFHIHPSAQIRGDLGHR